MFAKLESLERKYEELEKELSSPDVFDDQDRYKKLTKSHADLADVVVLFRKYRSLKEELEENKEMLSDSDPEIRQMAEAEIKSIRAELPKIEEEMQVLLLPANPLDEKNIILEIRAGTGGEEAALFAAELFRMYSRFAEVMRWKIEIMSAHDTGNRRIQGNHRQHFRQPRVLLAQVRVRHAPGAACSRHRIPGTHPYLRRDRGHHAGSRGGGCRYRPQ